MHIKGFVPGLEGTFINHACEYHGGLEVATGHPARQRRVGYRRDSGGVWAR